MLFNSNTRFVLSYIVHNAYYVIQIAWRVGAIPP